jgi:hypothetical protein
VPGFTSSICFDPRSQVGAIVPLNGEQSGGTVELAITVAETARTAAPTQLPKTDLAAKSTAGHVTLDDVIRVVHVPYAVGQDEDGVWCASAQLRPGVGAVGDGPAQEAAIAGLREALEVLLAETGPPDELTLTLNVA